jgi:hypothetical protein
VNYCSKTITVKNVTLDHNKAKSNNVPKEYIIPPGEIVDYEVDYEDEAK